MIVVNLRPDQIRQVVCGQRPGVEAKAEGRMKKAESGQWQGVHAALQAAFLDQSQSAA
ncbi:MAG: hypothetical protein WCK27_25490 [Verrucomicrobiota bacterium]|jgi:hypothetical protein